MVQQESVHYLAQLWIKIMTCSSRHFKEYMMLSFWTLVLIDLIAMVTNNVSWWITVAKETAHQTTDIHSWCGRDWTIMNSVSTSETITNTSTWPWLVTHHTPRLFRQMNVVCREAQDNAQCLIKTNSPAFKCVLFNRYEGWVFVTHRGLVSIEAGTINCNSKEVLGH